MSEAEKTIEDLKRKLRANTDAELARKLGVDKRTVSAWRTRNAVPTRYNHILNGLGHNSVATPPLSWGEYEKAAFELALYRLLRGLSPEFAEDNFRYQYKIVHHLFPAIWFLMRDAQQDISKYLEESDVPVSTAVAFLIHESQTENNGDLDGIRERLKDLAVPL